MSAPARGPGRLLLLMAALVAVVLLIVIRTIGGSSGNGGGSSARDASTSATLPVKATSYDPSGGSGFRPRSGGWTTQIYSSRTFGNLKPGIGLVLDLGAQHEVSAVSFTADDGPLSVELRAGDSGGGSQSYPPVSRTSSASGATTLKGADGGRHRYWMLWVTELGSANSATIRDVHVTGG